MVKTIRILLQWQWARIPRSRRTKMKHNLLSLLVRGKRDLILLRQRTRQIAALLGYSAQDQVCLAAAVFDLACQIHRRRGRTTWNFSLENRHLHICPGADGSEYARLRIEKPMPETLSWSW